MREQFDVIVAGGGTAGCVLASRLSEDPNRSVLLLEAGPDYGPLADGGWPVDMLDADADADLTHDWGFEGPSATRAKIIGGCSSHNECVVAWAPPGDHRSWALLGDRRWSFDTQRPLLERAQALLGTRTPPTRPLEDAFLQAVEELGLPFLENMNGPEWGPGAAVLPKNVVDGVRWNAAFAYLDAVAGTTCSTCGRSIELAFRQGHADDRDLRAWLPPQDCCASVIDELCPDRNCSAGRNISRSGGVGPAPASEPY